MNKVLSLTIAVLMFATMAYAQNGSIGIFASDAGTSCNIAITSPLLYVYFVHVNAVAATSSQWAAPHPPCMSATRLADFPPWEVMGDTETGVAIGYGSCKTGTFLLMSSLYHVTAAEPCCYWSVVADPHVASGKIEIVDCDFEMTYGTGGQGIVNAAESCNCNVPNEDTTWGQVKALYAE